MSLAAPTPAVFDLALPGMQLEAGARLDRHGVRGWWWGPASELDALRAAAGPLTLHESAEGWYSVVRRSRDTGSESRPGDAGLGAGVPTVLLVHALTGDMRAGGPGGWWEPVIGPGRALDPGRCRILCFNNLGSCYGTTGPADSGFPTREQDRRFAAASPAGKGAFAVPDGLLPATVTTWDMARSILLALDALHVGRVDLVAGGSLGGMVALCLAALAPERFQRLATFGATKRASPWQIGWNHLGRQAILADPGFPHSVGPGLALARAIGHMTYRAPAGIEQRQARRMAQDAASRDDATWSSRRNYAVESYLHHQGSKLLGRFDAASYLVQIGAMDHHDLDRWPGVGVGVARITASTLAVGIDSDVLFPPEEMRRLADELRGLGRAARFEMLTSAHGHDAFLIEWDQVGKLLSAALDLPAPGM
jgi:homoserine O-acetyltransferase